jgi:uncharacterized phage-associated protein
MARTQKRAIFNEYVSPKKVFRYDTPRCRIELSLVRLDRPLFDDEIQAWAAGPVVKSLFALHKGKYVVGPDDMGGSMLALDEDAQRTIDKVVAHYGKLSAAQLSELTHREAPWADARRGLGPAERGDAVIRPEAMFDFYLAKTRKPARE